MDNGKGLMVNVAWAAHPVELAVYVIVAVPPATPLTTPDADPTVAIPPLAALHVPVPLAPPPAGSLNAVVDPAHNTLIPLMAGGSGFTVMVVLVKHPVPME